MALSCFWLWWCCTASRFLGFSGHGSKTGSMWAQAVGTLWGARSLAVCLLPCHCRSFGTSRSLCFCTCRAGLESKIRSPGCIGLSKEMTQSCVCSSVCCFGVQDGRGPVYRLHFLRDELGHVQIFWDAFNHMCHPCLGGFDEDDAEGALSLSQESIGMRSRRRSPLASPVEVFLACGAALLASFWANSRM